MSPGGAWLREGTGRRPGGGSLAPHLSTNPPSPEEPNAAPSEPPRPEAATPGQKHSAPGPPAQRGPPGPAAPQHLLSQTAPAGLPPGHVSWGQYGIPGDGGWTFLGLNHPHTPSGALRLQRSYPGRYSLDSGPASCSLEPSFIALTGPPSSRGLLQR